MVDIISDFHCQGFDKIAGIKHVLLNQLIQFYVIDRLIHLRDDRDGRFETHVQINYKFVRNLSFLFIQSMMSKKTKVFEFDGYHSNELMKPFLAQISLSIQCCHTTCTSRSHCLPVNFILDITACKYSFNIGL